MKLYLVRHADAVPLGEQGITADGDRPLSERGLQDARRLGLALKKLGVAGVKILASPLRRAMQTAEELARALQGAGVEIMPCEELEPGGSPKKLAKYLRRSISGDVILVGHEPDISRHTGRLLGAKKARVEFAKGAVACIVCDRPPRKGAGALRWLLTPECLPVASA
jgi:phosphohistidine phosphatase